MHITNFFDSEGGLSLSNISENGEYRSDMKYSSERRKNGEMTPAAEDYLEMIYRLSTDDGGEKKPVRICTLANCLHVSPSSASRMAQSMSTGGYVDFKRYGYIMLTEKGAETGRYFIKRHKTVLAFLKWLTGDERFVETERIEHYLSRDTVEKMEEKLNESQAVKEENALFAVRDEKKQKEFPGMQSFADTTFSDGASAPANVTPDLHGDGKLVCAFDETGKKTSPSESEDSGI